MKIFKNVLLIVVCLALIVPAALLASGKLPYRIYVVHTGSMVPTIPPKSAVIVKEGAYHVGQVISFETVNGVVTHRLVKRNADGTLVTKGDANQTVDPGAPLQPTQVIGGVVAAPRLVGYWLLYLKNPTGMASLIMTIVCLWLIYSLTTAYDKRAQQKSAAAVKRGSRASEAPRKLPVEWRFVEWPLDADALAAWSGQPQPAGGSGLTVDSGSLGTSRETALPRWRAVTRPASEPARHYTAMGRMQPRRALAKPLGAYRPIW
jgi:signal peptidase I